MVNCTTAKFSAVDCARVKRYCMENGDIPAQDHFKLLLAAAIPLYGQVFSNHSMDEYIPNYRSHAIFFFFFFLELFLLSSAKSYRHDTLQGLMGPRHRVPVRQAGVTLAPGHPFTSTPTSIGSLWECADIACNRWPQKHTPYEILSCPSCALACGEGSKRP